MNVTSCDSFVSVVFADGRNVSHHAAQLLLVNLICAFVVSEFIKAVICSRG